MPKRVYAPRPRELGKNFPIGRKPPLSPSTVILYVATVCLNQHLLMVWIGQMYRGLQFIIYQRRRRQPGDTCAQFVPECDV